MLSLLTVLGALAQDSDGGLAEEPPPTEEAQPWDRVGWGWGGVPALNFNSDEGAGFGIVASLYRYNGELQPYKTSVTLILFATTKAVQSHSIEVDALRVANTPLRLTVRGSLDAIQVDNYCGVGPDVTCDPAGAEAAADRQQVAGADREAFLKNYYRTRYVLPYLRIDARYALDPMPHRFELVGGYRAELILPGTFSDPTPWPGSLYEQDFPGGERGLLSVVQAGVMLDNRDNEPSPTRGYWVEATGRLAAPFLGSEWTYGGFNTTLRGYLPLFTDRLVFADRAVVDVIAGEASIRELANLGGTQRYWGYGSQFTGRGIRQRRFIGEAVAFNQAELRALVAPFQAFGVPVDVHLLGFLDVGFVGAETRDFGRMFRTPLPGGGGGLRLAFDKNFIIRADMGFSSFEEGSSLYIDIRNLF